MELRINKNFSIGECCRVTADAPHSDERGEWGIVISMEVEPPHVRYRVQLSNRLAFYHEHWLERDEAGFVLLILNRYHGEA